MVLQKPEDAPRDVPTPPVGSVVKPPPEEVDSEIAAIESIEEPTPQEKLHVPTFQPKPQPHQLSDSTRNILLAISGVFLVVAFCTAWLLLQNVGTSKDTDDKKAASSQQIAQKDTAQTPVTTPDIPCADDLTVYKNQDLGFGFCYPAVWGAVTVADGKLAGGDTGKRWKVSFADKKQVQVTLVTKEWSTTKTNDFACAPTNADVPSFTLTTAWAEQKDGTTVTSVMRGIEASDNKYILQEFAEAASLKGACLQGFTLLDGGTYHHTIATYQAAFDNTIQAPDQHAANPETLIPATERSYIAALTKSVQAL